MRVITSCDGKKARTMCSGCVHRKGSSSVATRETAGESFILVLPGRALLPEASFLLLVLSKASYPLGSSCPWLALISGLMGTQ